MGDFDIFDKPQAPDFSDFDAPVTAPTKRSFLDEAGRRAREVFAPIAHVTIPDSPADAWERLKQNAPEMGRGIVEGAKGLGKSVLAANAFANHTVLHPLDAIDNRKATGNELLRGVYGNVPLLNLVNERAFGVPEESPDDAMAAPGAREFGMLTGPLAGKFGEAAVPAVARAATAVGDVAKSVGKASVERSAERGVTGIADATKGAAKKAVAKALEHGHAAAPAVVERVALTAADEAIAAIARKLGIRPDDISALDAPAAPVAHGEPASPPAQSPAAEETAPVGDPQIAALRAALVDADPKQAEVIKGAIAGLEQKAARVGPKSAPHVESPFGAQPELWGGRKANLDTPDWSPSEDDAKYAKGLNLTVPEYRDLMARMALKKAAR